MRTTLVQRWDAFKALFERQDIPWMSEGNPGDEIEEEFEGVWDHASIFVNEEWGRVRSLIMRGASAGAVAALTLMGSQSLGSATPKASVFWVLVIFLLTLAVVGLRQLLLVWFAVISRSGRMAHVPDGGGYTPPPILEKAARCCDYASTILLVVGVVFGLRVLYGLTQVEGAPCTAIARVVAVGGTP